MYKFFIIVLSVFIVSCHQPYKNPHIIISTQFGDIEVELFPEQAPKTVAAFLSYVDSGYYTKGSFYRVLKAEELPTSNNTGIIQGGMWQATSGPQPLIRGIDHETTRQTGLSHVSGTISLARTTVGSANTEFFICIGSQKQFDYGNDANEDRQGYAAFGKVFKGMPIVRKIQDQQSHGDKFDKKIEISEIRRL